MKYNQVWNAVDNLAKSQGLTPSGLAKKAGLDATTFNKSKRVRNDGKKRWPSLDSINKVIEVCNMSFSDFYKLAESNESLDYTSTIPFAKQSEIITPDLKDKKIDTSNWNKINFPDGKDTLYAIEIDEIQPATNNIFRQDSIIVISKNSDIRRGDRIAIFDIDNQIIFAEFIRRTSSTIEIKSLSTAEESSLELSKITLINRILWISQ